MPESGTTSAGFKPLPERPPPDVPAQWRTRSQSCRDKKHKACTGGGAICWCVCHDKEQDA